MRFWKQESYRKAEIINLPHPRLTAKDACMCHPRESGKSGKPGETCEFAVPLNVFRFTNSSGDKGWKNYWLQVFEHYAQIAG